MFNTAWKFSCNRFPILGRALLGSFLATNFPSPGRANRVGLHVQHCDRFPSLERALLGSILARDSQGQGEQIVSDCMLNTAWKFSCNRFKSRASIAWKFSCKRFLSLGRANRFGLHLEHCLEVFLQQIPKSRAGTAWTFSCNLGRALLGRFLATDSQV